MYVSSCIIVVLHKGNSLNIYETLPTTQKLEMVGLYGHYYTVLYYTALL